MVWPKLNGAGEGGARRYQNPGRGGQSGRGGGARYLNPEIKETRRKCFGNNFFLDG